MLQQRGCSCDAAAVMLQREDLHEQATGSGGIGGDGSWKRTETLLSWTSSFTGQDEGRGPNNSNISQKTKQVCVFWVNKDL